jgi:hypothetical protein
MLTHWQGRCSRTLKSTEEIRRILYLSCVHYSDLISLHTASCEKYQVAGPHHPFDEQPCLLTLRYLCQTHFHASSSVHDRSSMSHKHPDSKELTTQHRARTSDTARLEQCAIFGAGQCCGLSSRVALAFRIRGLG